MKRNFSVRKEIEIVLVIVIEIWMKWNGEIDGKSKIKMNIIERMKKKRLENMFGKDEEGSDILESIINGKSY